MIATHDVAMAAEIFRGRMHDEIGAERERLLNDRCPGVVANADRAAFVHDLVHGRDIDHFQERIRRRFDPDQFRFRLQRFFHRVEVAHIDECRFQSPAQK